jgi:hypothetical protein
LTRLRRAGARQVWLGRGEFALAPELLAAAGVTLWLGRIVTPKIEAPNVVVNLV